MAVASITYNFDSLLSTTLMNYRNKLYDNVFNAIPFFYWIHENKRKRVEDGGERIVIPLEYARNSTVKSMEGYDTIDTTPQDPFTSCYWEWKETAGSISISNKQLVQNSGKSKVIDLLQSLTRNTEASMAEEIHRQILGPIYPGNSGKDFESLNRIVQKDPTSSTATIKTVGGIDQSSYAFWRNRKKQSATSTTVTWAKLLAEMANMFNLCSRGGGAGGKRGYPDLILCDQIAYEIYEGACRDKTRIYNEKVADLGYGGIKFKGCTMMWDEYVIDVEAGTEMTSATVDTYWTSTSTDYSTMYFLNSDYLEFIVAKGNDLTVGPFIQPENQKAKTSIIYIMGNVVCSNRAKQGVLYKIDQEIAA